METIQTIELKCGTIELLDSGIIKLKYTSDFIIDILDVKEVEKVFKTLCNNKDIYCLMDTSNSFNNFTNEAQKFLSNEASIVKEKKLKGSAVVIDNLPNRMMARFFNSLHQPTFPMKFFSNIEDGHSWLVAEQSNNI